jgi:hypothetical protein
LTAKIGRRLKTTLTGQITLANRFEFINISYGQFYSTHYRKRLNFRRPGIR